MVTPDWLSFLIILSWPVTSGGLLWFFFRRSRAAVAGPTGLRLVAGNALALLFFASAGFLLAECYYRFLRDTTDSFSCTRSSDRWFGRHYHVNNALARDNIDYQLRIAPGKRRVTFLGDSFTVGHGIKDVEDRFANLIRLAFPEVEVHVAAHVGFETGNELNTVNFLAGNGYEFDQVMLVYNLNDISDLLPEWRKTLERIQGGRTQTGWLALNSYFINTLYFHYKAARDPDFTNYFSQVRTAYEGPTWMKQRERLLEVRRAVEANGGHLSVVTFPFLHALGPDYAFRDAHAMLGQFWSEQGVPQLDLLATFQGIPPGELVVNRFDAHPNEHAHQLAAEAIARFLQQSVLGKAKR
jgi:hypothetical protein